MNKGFKARYDKHGVFLGYDETGALVASIDGTPEGIAAMRSRIEGAFTPAARDQVEEWLAELAVLAPRRNDGDGNAALVVSAYSQRLSGYPADVVREALLGRVWRFWPSWAELHEVCEDLTKQRRAVRAELDRAAADQIEAGNLAVERPSGVSGDIAPQNAQHACKAPSAASGDGAPNG